MKQTMMVLGAAGYIGKTVVQQAVKAGWTVKALVRNAAAASDVMKLGAQSVIGDVLVIDSWLDEARGCHCMVDLIQPRLPKRLSRRSIQAAADYRLKVTNTIISGLKKFTEKDRPLFINVSGVDDLEADSDGLISHHSNLVRNLKGFARIGVPVRKQIELSGMGALHLYLGTVYGPGKAFAETVIPGLMRRKLPIIGSGENHLALIYVEDAARAIIHLCKQADKLQSGSTWVITDGVSTTQAEFINGIATLLKVNKPRRVPVWIASLFVGVVTSEVLTRESKSDNSALLGLGFKLNYLSWHDGAPQMLKLLGYTH